MGSIIKIENISKSFGDLQVLNGFSLTVNKGDVIAVIGSSGSGKSTLLRCLVGLEPFQEGVILVDEKPIGNQHAGYAGIGMVFQQFNLFPHYTVEENIYKPCCTVKKMNKVVAKQKAKELLQKVHLEDKSNQYPANLSGGQKQRVAIARALAMEPEIILFDEPTSSLDPELAHEVFETIRDLAKEGLTMLMVTHQINAIKNFANRVVFVHQGKVEVDGSTEYVLKHCENINLRSFLRRVEFEDLN